MRTILILFIVLLLAACDAPVPAESPPGPVATPTEVAREEEVEGFEVTGEGPGVATPTEVAREAEVQREEEPEEILRGGISLYGMDGPASLDEMIAKSPIIIRGTLASVTPVGVRSVAATTSDLSNLQFDGFHGSLEFTFNVLEYLKGSGGSQVKGIAYGTNLYEVLAGTRAEAARLARPLLDGRDARWDNREAIVFFREAQGKEFYPQLQSELDYYYLGEVSSHPGTFFDITVASAEAKAWLPGASSGSDQTRAPGAPGAPGEQRFLLDEPASTSGSGSAARFANSAGSSPSISLTALKAKVLKQEKDAGGSQPYRDCVAETLEQNRRGQHNSYRAMLSSVTSGLAAETTVYVYEDAATLNLAQYGSTEPDNSGESWYEGRDAHLLDNRYPGYLFIKRPLPAGEYRAFLFWRSEGLIICDGYPESRRNKFEHIITVTAPEGILAEAFFDPMQDGDAITATTTVGTIKWESGKVKAMLTPTVTNHVLDFISLDGSVLLSLDVTDATTTDGVLSWTVASSPWSAGDQLMVRIR